MTMRGALLGLCVLLGTGGAAVAQVTSLPSETPAEFKPAAPDFDFVRRTAMIPMRDGVKLFTVLYVPKGAQHAPMLLTRTPYGAGARFAQHDSAHIDAVVGDGDVGDELVGSGQYIRVIQDIRGKHQSEGDYVMTRPLIGPLNPTKVDHATDTYDTIDWLVRNVPESNGHVGILGISYDGFTSLMALVNPHPALRAAVPINPMVDGWMGDDWFHNGAFRQDSIAYIVEQEGHRDASDTWWLDNYDNYESWLNAGNVATMAKRHGADQLGFTQKIFAHPSYDAFWQGQALDRLLAQQPLKVPVMLVHSLFDQEDIYGALHVYKALKPKDTEGDKVFLVAGPWFHHQQRLDGTHVGALTYPTDTARFFRHVLLKAFFDHFLLDNPPARRPIPAVVYETGTNQWLPLANWPAPLNPAPQKFYLAASGKLANDAPAADAGYSEYMSDPARPVPFLPRPIHLQGEAGEADWQTWLASDQRPASSRTDVLTFEGPVLDQKVRIAGPPIANLVASTTGTDGDFVVKLIDVYPPEMGREPKMGGYQLMVSGDIFRGRYRQGFDKPAAIPAGETQTYRFEMPNASHAFLPGHRIMVQVQSSWFPLYDRNPQSYVDNIFFAPPDAYRKATIRIRGDSFVELPVVKP